MASTRSLPEARNPLVLPEHTPPLEILIERRRLGQTNLHVKPGQVGVSNATRAENLGLFDYAHLRVPLPKDLKGSGIFNLQKNQAYPESYFLMRRSNDGYISATGMFKAAFPWASLAEEETERTHHKSLPTAGDEEVAGNVWISPDDALSLADEYGMKAWIVALVDPAPIEKGTKDKGSHEISTPPKFIVPDKNQFFPPASATTVRTRGRELRSASPSKSSPRKIASPRKPRTTRKSAREAREGTPSALSKELESTPAPSEPAESVNGEGASVGTDKVRVEVDETVTKEGEVETTTTAVKVDVPADHPELPLPQSPEEMVANARKMVEEANKAEGSRSAQKRKADDLSPNDEDADERSMEVQPVKKTKVLEEELRKERVRSKAFMGLSATLAIGAMIPFFQSLL
ncbi:apses transcription factor [Diplodia corticola]|uniref:Apses transcription factor n=1 Tax=Diplodia corticola TaxID=236234 RepID=A0A1J9S796_9PEZI|nr:apses transcription factor [Diplodia corticola]OJD40827.1 apses transcription factor [Diplodia corticola]